MRFFDRGTNMLSLWDGGIIEWNTKNEDVWLKELTEFPSPQRPDNVTDGTVEDWATESLLAAREAYVEPVTGQRIKSGAKVGLDYRNKNIPVVKERMYLAGVRLAKRLNEAFASQ